MNWGLLCFASSGSVEHVGSQTARSPWSIRPTTSDVPFGFGVPSTFPRRYSTVVVQNFRGDSDRPMKRLVVWSRALQSSGISDVASEYART